MASPDRHFFALRGSRPSRAEDRCQALDPDPARQEELLAFFTDDEPPVLVPVPMVPIASAALTEPLPLTMTALQQLAAADNRGCDVDDLERTWFERRRMRRSERVMLSAALYVSAERLRLCNWKIRWRRIGKQRIVSGSPR